MSDDRLTQAFLEDLVFEQNEELQILRERLERYEEVGGLLALYLSHSPFPFMPTDAALMLWEEGARYGAAGATVPWIRMAKEVKERGRP